MKFGNLIKCAAWIAALASVFACAKEVGPGYEEGLPVTSIKMSISAPGQDKVDISTKATEAVESAVEQIAIFFYKANDEKAMPIVSEITPAFASNVGSNYQYNIVIPAQDLEEMRSGKWYMYAVANYGKGFFPVDINALKGLTRNQFLDYCITKQNNALDILETSVLMSGKYCSAGKTYDQCDGSLDIKPGENKLDGIIRLRRSVAKITFKFVNGSHTHTVAGTTTTAHVTFKPESYGLYEYSRSCTLMERDWNDDIAYMGDLSVSEENRFHNGSDFPVTGSQFVFYMPENVQTRNVKGTPDNGWTYFNREERNSDGVENPTQEQYNTFKYAPKHGTFVAVKGTISIPEENYSGDVTYYIHLGNFTESADDFTVRRNYHYTYTIKVNGVDNIIAEAKAEDNSEIQPGAEGNITHTTDAYLDVRLDSHYETVLLKVKADVDAGTYAVRVNSPYSKNVMVKSTDDPADFEAKKKDLDYGWIRFGKPATTTADGNKAYRSYPGDANTTDVFGLITALQSANPTEKYWREDTYNGEAYYYTIAYVNEYYYEDKMNAEGADKTAVLKEFINADDRTMSVILGPNVFESKDGHSTYTDLTHGFFNISQRSIKTFYDLSVENPFGIEQIEETAATSKYEGTGNDSDNGYANNPAYSSSSIFGVTKYSWSDYISNGFNGHVQMAKDNAEYQCLSRNRDENGDGKIDGEELKWYLPSVNQCAYYWFGMNSLPEDARIELIDRKENSYWTSTKAHAKWWAAEGSAYGPNDKSSNKVRCVRSLKTYNAVTTDVSVYDATNRVVTMKGMDEKSVRAAGTVTGEYATHYRGSELDVLPSSFQIATRNLQQRDTPGGTGTDEVKFTNEDMKNPNKSSCASYFEAADGSDKGKWRVPNEEELTLILKWLRDDNNYGGKDRLDKVASRTAYKRHDSTGDMVYYILISASGDKPLIITTGDAAGKIKEFRVRCVRDVVK